MDDDTALAIAAEIERESRVQEGQEEEKKGEEFVSEADRAAAAQELVARLRKEARERERAKKSVESEDRSKFLSDGAGIPGAACILDAVIVPDGKRLNKLKGESPAAGTVTQAKVRHAHGADIMTLTYPDAGACAVRCVRRAFG